MRGNDLEARGLADEGDGPGRQNRRIDQFLRSGKSVFLSEGADQEYVAPRLADRLQRDQLCREIELGVRRAKAVNAAVLKLRVERIARACGPELKCARWHGVQMRVEHQR